MNPLIHIVPAAIIPSETNFFAELSKNGLSFFFQQNDNKMITGLSVFNFAPKDVQKNTADHLKTIFIDQELLKERFNKTYLISTFGESILTPGDYYILSHNNENLNLIHGDLNEGIVFTDHIAERNIYNIYRLSKDIHLVITDHFGQLTVMHQYSSLLKQLTDPHDVLKVIVYPAKIVVTLQNGGKLQIIESFIYITAEDVAYHMLNLCKQFNVTNINVQVSGMIEKDSALIREIRKYFLNIHFSDLPAELLYAEDIKKFPAHFFSHLFAYTLCV